MKKNLFIIFSGLVFFFYLSLLAVQAEVVNFRTYDPAMDQTTERHCYFVSLSENLGVKLNGAPAPGCTFTADVVFNGDWVFTGNYFDSPPYTWGGAKHFYDPGSSVGWMSFSCANPTYNLDTNWLPADVQLVSSQNISSSDDAIAPSKRYTFKVANNAVPGDSFDLALDASTNCTLYKQNKGGSGNLTAETVDSTNTSVKCYDLAKVNINPRNPQLDYPVTISSSSCVGPTPTTGPTSTPTPKPTKTPTPTPPPGSTPTPTGGPPTPTDTPDPTDTPGPTPTGFHLACSAISCIAVSGAGANTCNPQGAKCVQTQTGGTCSATCGTGTITQTCNCSGPCCPGSTPGVSGSGICKSGLVCGTTGTTTCCKSQDPQSPTNLRVAQPDGSTAHIHTRFVKLTWDFPPGGAQGCGTAWGYNCNGSSKNFYIQIDDNDDFSSPIVDLPNISPNVTSYTTTLADGPLTANTTYYAQVCAVNYDATCIQKTFTKEPYPVGIVFGNVGEFAGNSSVPFTNTGASDSSITININPPVTTGINTTCSKTTGSNPSTTKKYSCTISLDNVNNDPIPTQIFTLSTSGSNTNLYTNPCFQTGANTCDTNTTFPINLDTNILPTTTNANHDVYFIISSNLSFFKLKNTSLQTHNSSAWSSYFPVGTSDFDSIDDYTTGGNYLIIGDAPGSFTGVGTALFNTPVGFGAGMASEKSVPFPPGKNWGSQGYVPVTAFNHQRYLDYVKTRKEYQTISNLNQLKSGIINVWNSNSLTIDNGGAAHFNSKNVVLIVPGSVYFSISNDQFTPSNAATAILADTINFSNSAGTKFLSDANGIFIGNTIHLGANNQPLKVIGNIASTRDTVSLERVRDDNRMPSLFVVFQVDPYVDLLSQLSTAIYEWKQLQ